MAKPAGKTGRNDSCPCGSGRKFKRCCETKTRNQSSRFLLIVVGAALIAALGAVAASFMSESSPASTRVYDPAHGHYHDASGRQVP